MKANADERRDKPSWQHCCWEHENYHTENKQRNECDVHTASVAALGRRHPSRRRHKDSEVAKAKKWLQVQRPGNRSHDHPERCRPADWRQRRTPRRRSRVASEAVHLYAVAGDKLLHPAVVDGDQDLTLRPRRRPGWARRERMSAAADVTQTEFGRVLQLTTGSRAQLQHLRPSPLSSSKFFIAPMSQEERRRFIREKNTTKTMTSQLITETKKCGQILEFPVFSLCVFKITQKLQCMES